MDCRPTPSRTPPALPTDYRPTRRKPARSSKTDNTDSAKRRDTRSVRNNRDSNARDNSSRAGRIRDHDNYKASAHSRGRHARRRRGNDRGAPPRRGGFRSGCCEPPYRAWCHVRWRPGCPAFRRSRSWSARRCGPSRPPCLFRQLQRACPSRWLRCACPFRRSQGACPSHRLWYGCPSRWSRGARSSRRL